ncbi:MAG: hypothetical protein IPK22_16400 [Verrucomicrobiaceae bacterium]|nr:hypothetical protein [Verrucomicrobiaceae bacterium]
MLNVTNDLVPSQTAMLWSQEFIDALSLARHRTVAEMLATDPGIIETARTNAERWLTSGNYDAGESYSVSEWLPLLEATRRDELIEALTSPSQNATRMRQSSPFTGIIPKPAYRILRERLIQEWSRHAA